MAKQNRARGTTPNLTALVLSATLTAAFSTSAAFADPASLKSGRSLQGGWGEVASHADTLTDAAHQQLRNDIDEAIARLGPFAGRTAFAKRGVAGTKADPKADTKADVTVRFAWPVRPADGRPEFAAYGISNYLDHDPATGQIQDFNCGTRSYDLASGYRHTGTDIFISPLAWRKMDGEEALVIAAAAGRILLKTDGNADRTCGQLANLPSGLPANRLVLLHDDGTTTIYLHMKSGTLTPKAVGQLVAEGEYLGTVGSSGFSSGPHLHFEVQDSTGRVVDPWAGACNPDITQSLWKAQEAYISPHIVDLTMSRVAPPTAVLSPPCTNNIAETLPLSSYFKAEWTYAPGDTLYLTSWLRDLRNGDALTFRILRPDGTVFLSEAFTSEISSALFAAAYYYRGPVVLPVTAVAGEWRFEVTFGAETRSVRFQVGTPSAPLMMEDFYHPNLNHYFRTSYPEEAAIVRSGGAGPGWQDLNDRYGVLPVGSTASNAVPVCRFYGSVTPGPNSHFYTASQAECDYVKSLQQATPANQPRWNYEGIAFSSYLPENGVCPRAAPYPVYRLYNNRAAEVDSNHRFTTLTSLALKQAALGWSLEGVAMCAVSKP